MEQPGAIVVTLDVFDGAEFASEPRGKREVYLWLGCVGATKLQTRRLAAEWRWPERDVMPFVRRMLACGLFVKVGDYISAVKIAEAERHPERIIGESWSRLRLRVFVRDSFACTYCGSTTDLHCDHVFPRARGGLDVESNLTTACAPCNLSKGARTPEEWLA